MIEIGNAEYIKAKGDFGLNALHVKKFALEFPTCGNSKQVLVIELVPFAYLDDGSRVYDLDKVYKIVISDAEAFLSSGKAPTFIPAYFATEQAISEVVNDKFPFLQTTFRAPQ